MAVETLAEAAILVRPDLSQATAGVESAGRKAGQQYADGFFRDSSGRLRASSGRFATDAEKAMVEGGKKSGSGFAGGFTQNAKSTITGGLKDIAKVSAGFLIPAGIGAAVKEIAQIGMAYENNLNTFQAVSGATAKQMGMVSEKARQLGADVKLPGVSAAGAAEAMLELSKAGFTVQQSMDAARATLLLARVAHISEAQAAEISANAVNAFGLKAKDTTMVVDELAAAANSSSVEIGDVSLAFKMAAAVFSGFQGPAVGSKEAITELNTAIAILGNNGIKGSDAGTSLKQMMLQLTGPSDKASSAMAYLADRAFGANISLAEQTKILHGGKAARDAAQMSIEGHNKALATEGGLVYDSAGKMRSLRDILDLVIKGTQGLTAEERNYAITQIFGADASRSIIALMKGGLPVYDAQRKAVLQQGAAAKVAAAQNKGLSGALDNVRSQLENAAIGIYNSVKGPLTKALNDLASGLSNVFGFIGTHSAVFKDLAVAVGVTAAALGAYKTVMFAVTAAQKAWIALQTVIAFVQLATEVRSFAAAWALLDVAMDANPIGIVVVALGALVAGIVYAWKHSQTFRTVVLAVWGAIKTAVGATVSWFTGTVLPVLTAVWHGIATAVQWAWEKVIKPTLTMWVSFFRSVVAPVFMWLWHNVVEPVAHGIGRVIQAATAVIQLAFAIVVAYVKDVLVPTWLWLWHRVVTPVMSGITSAVRSGISVVTSVFNSIVGFIRRTFGPIWTTLYNSAIKPFWDRTRAIFGAGWNAVSGFFSRIATWITRTLPNAFSTGVSAIGRFWGRLEEVAKAPITFTVNHIINPVINGFNKVAKAFGTQGIPPIAGFAEGGRIPGNPSSRDNRWAWLKDGNGNVLGQAGLATGEFVVNARDTAKALPLLQWINDGMRGGPQEVQRRIGRPLTDMPGDGSQGWAFASGGLVGFLKDVYAAAANPGALIKAPIEAMVRQIPGAGAMRDILVGMGHRLISGLTHWLSSSSVVSAGIGGAINTIPLVGRALAARSFVQAQAGKPYVWASAGPGGYDCSGIVSAVWNVLHGRSPYSHTFSTGSLPGHFFRQGSRNSPLIAGWSNPGEPPASSSTGHMAGQIGGLPFESRGSRGVIVGAGARRVGQFAHIGAAYNDGGLVRIAKIAKADFGAVTLERGWNMIQNGTGKPEPLVSPGMGGGDIHLHFHGPVASKAAAKAMVYDAVVELRRDRKLSTTVLPS